MSELLQATDLASRAGLTNALKLAATAGSTSAVETLLGAFTEHHPEVAEDEAIRALNYAVDSRKWETASYLADYLVDTARKRPNVGLPRSGIVTSSVTVGGKPYQNRVTEHIDQEVLRCLREHVTDSVNDKPFRLTDVIEEKCVNRGIDFALSVAIVDCAAKGVPQSDRLECARQMVAGDTASVITFGQADPDLPPDVYGGADNPCDCFGLSGSEYSSMHLLGPTDLVVPPGEIRVKFTDPPSMAGTYTITSDGTRKGLAQALAVKYQELFDVAGSTRDLSEFSLSCVRRLSAGLYSAEVNT